MKCIGGMCLVSAIVAAADGAVLEALGLGAAAASLLYAVRRRIAS